MFERSVNCKGLVLVTGGAGYVGSHTLIELLNSGYDVVCLDNCVNSIRYDSDSLPVSLQRVEQICGRKLVEFVDTDLLDEAGLHRLFTTYSFDAVIHFAGLKAVGESCSQPLRYYRNNTAGTLNLLQAMADAQCARLIFSSSCTVYGSPQYLPVDEEHPTGLQIINPYGRTKFMIEQILRDCAEAEKNFGVISLRYFNPIGAHESGLIGEDPQGIPNNLMPYITQVAVGRLSHVNVFGNDYDTSDGTGVRDYIHVMDLAKGHVLALNKLIKQNWTGFHPINLGTGRGYSVLELINAFEKTNKIKIPYEITCRRDGDISCVYADAVKAKEVLGWEAVHSILDMCRDGWKWQTMNPHGFKKTIEPSNGSNSSNGSKSNGHFTNGRHATTTNGLTSVHKDIEPNNNHVGQLSLSKCKTSNGTLITKADKELNNNVQQYVESAQYKQLIE